jgi:hypothetical protein
MGTDRLTVSFCCNDHRGNPLDFVQDVEVGELIQLEGPFDFDGDMPRGTTPFSWYGWFPAAVVINDELFFHHGRSRHAGNLLWDSAEMDRSEFVRLLNHLRTIGGWSCVEAEASLSSAWEHAAEITVDDLERASGS